MKHTTGIKLHKLNQLGNVKLHKIKTTQLELNFIN
jgi:hypothetical protein